MSQFNKIKCFLSILLFITITPAFAQRSPILGNFDLSKNEGKVYLNWSIVAGSFCNGILIFRSTDNENFELIGTIPGVCGDVSSSVSYNFVDYRPIKNKTNYYKLELGSPNDIGVQSIEVTDILESGYQVRPNPTTDKALIYFNNDKRKSYQFSLYDLNGVLVFFTTTEKDIIELDTKGFAPGVYAFNIIGGGSPTKIVGKVVVQ